MEDAKRHYLINFTSAIDISTIAVTPADSP